MLSLHRMNSGRKLITQTSLMKDIKEGSLTRKQHLEIHHSQKNAPQSKYTTRSSPKMR